MITSRQHKQQVQTISVIDALKLTSWEGGYYCRNCEGCILACFQSPGEHTSFGMSCFVSDLLDIKRAEKREKKSESYERLLRSIARYGLRSPLGVCSQGTCLTDGHHRLAALVDLGITDVEVSVFEHEDGCSCNEVSPTHLEVV